MKPCLRCGALTDGSYCRPPFIPGAHPSGDDRVQLLAPLAFAAVRSGPGSIDDHVRVEVGQRTVAPLWKASYIRRTISTFSSGIAYSRSPAVLRASARVQKT
jgi:hypothetical protein